MKFFILALCICTAVAEESFLDYLDKILSNDDKSEVNVLEKPNEALNKEEREALLDSSSPEEKPENGYCLDGITPADGPSQKGCAKKLCYDGRVEHCTEVFKGLSKPEKKTKCDTSKDYYEDHCPYSCEFCKPPSPTIECAKKYGERARYGCCWDGSPALTPDKSDCMACKDFAPITCKRFYDNMNGQGCGTNSYYIRRFFSLKCPKMCGRCI